MLKLAFAGDTTSPFCSFVLFSDALEQFPRIKQSTHVNFSRSVTTKPRTIETSDGSKNTKTAYFVRSINFFKAFFCSSSDITAFKRSNILITIKTTGIPIVIILTKELTKFGITGSISIPLQFTNKFNTLTKTPLSYF